MAEAKQIVFTHRELAEILVRRQKIAEGHWGVFVRFGIQGLNVNVSATQAGTSMVPAALVPIIELGIQRFDEPNGLTVDASTLKEP